MSGSNLRDWCVMAVVLGAVGTVAISRPANAQVASAPQTVAPPAAFYGVPQAPMLTVARQSEVDAESEAKIRSQLEGVTVIEFIETPLQDAGDYLKDLHRIEIQLDEKALQSAGQSSETPITYSVKEISLGSALRRMLSAIGATYIVHDGMLLITTPLALSQTNELRVYDVGDLLEPDAPVDALAEVLSLADVRITPYRNLLVVRASIAQHEVVADLLATLRKQLPVEAN